MGIVSHSGPRPMAWGGSKPIEACGMLPHELVAQRVGGLIGKSKNPSLTLLNVALSGMGLDGSVGGITG